jgi:hypothetical protein
MEIACRAAWHRGWLVGYSYLGITSALLVIHPQLAVSSQIELLTAHNDASGPLRGIL